MRRITEKEINANLNQSNRPTLYSNSPVPSNDLSDRAFEILLYFCFKERVKSNDSELQPFCDNVSLMQGVEEQGRDVIFSKNQVITGIIQCKKYKQNISKPEVCQEVLKFVLYSMEDNSLIDDIDNFHYYFAASTGFSGTSIGLFTGCFHESILQESKLKEWIEGIFKDYPRKFKGWKYNDKIEEIKKRLEKIKFKKIIPQDIEYWLSEYETLNKHFFKVLTVTDNTLIEAIINTYLKPILHKLNLDGLDTPDYTFRFKEYLKRIFEEYSSARTLVFGNQQKKLEDIYYPLTVVKTVEPKKSEEEKTLYKIDKFSDDFLPAYKKVLVIDDGGWENLHY